MFSDAHKKGPGYDEQLWADVQHAVLHEFGPSPDRSAAPDDDPVRIKNQTKLWTLKVLMTEMELLSQQPVSPRFFFRRLAEHTRVLLGADGTAVWTTQHGGPIIAQTVYKNECEPVQAWDPAARVRIIETALSMRRMQFVTLSPPFHQAGPVVQDWQKRLGEDCAVRMELTDFPPVDASMLVSPIDAPRGPQTVLEVQIPHASIYPGGGQSPLPSFVRRTKALADTAANFLTRTQR